MNPFRTYFYSFHNDEEIYTLQFQSDVQAEIFILDTYSKTISAIWRPERTLYENERISTKVPKVQSRLPRWANSR